MADDPIDLRSVNWSQGMFLTPDHFLRQERYFDSALLWLLHYALPSAGIVGGGPRVESADRGAARFDPVVDVEDSGDTLKISVTQCRAVTPGGAIIEIAPDSQLTASFPRRELETAIELGVYIVCRPHDKQPADGIDDPINPQMQAVRRARCQIKVDLQADEVVWSVLVIRLRRADRGLRFERVGDFIPPCAFMTSHSELMHAFRQLNERVTIIADHYSALHRAIVDFVAIARARSLAIDQDLETLSFVRSMVLTLEECAYGILDPLQPPKQFFQQLNRLVRNSALFLSLSPPTREYFRLLGEIGETEFVAMLEQEGEVLEMNRRGALDVDLRLEVQKNWTALERLDRLEQALEGRYMDYRISPSLESINFVFDRTSGDPVLYKSVAKPARPQAHGQEMTFVFAPLRLEAREQYRLILVGDRQARFANGDTLTVELLINHGEGYDRGTQYRSSDYEVDGQRNFAVDFSAPEDVVTINDVRVTLRSSQPIRSAILYVRARLMAAGAFRPAVSTPSPKQVRPEQRGDWSAPAPTDVSSGRQGSRLSDGGRSTTPSPPPGPRKRLS
jgi:hypothetical protein